MPRAATTLRVRRNARSRARPAPAPDDDARPSGVGSIIQEAKAKRAKIATRITGLEAEIAELEEEMGARREEIKALRDDDAETHSVQQRLEMTTKAPARQAAKDPIPSGFGFGDSAPSGPLLEPPGV